MKRVVVGSDHAGFKVKELLKNLLERWGYRVEDVGAYEENPRDDYPLFAKKVALGVLEKRGERDSGLRDRHRSVDRRQQSSRHPGGPGPRCGGGAAQPRTQRREPLVLGGWGYDKKEIPKILKTWLEAKFQGAGTAAGSIRSTA